MPRCKVASGAFPPERREAQSPGKLEADLPFAKRLQLQRPFLDVEALIRATPQFFEYPECDLDPLPRCTQARVKLLCDGGPL